MAKKSKRQVEILVATAEDTRGIISTRRLKVDELSKQVQEFISLIDVMLSSISVLSSGFKLSEVEISAEITSKGSVALLGTGGEMGASGGIKFVFRTP